MNKNFIYSYKRAQVRKNQQVCYIFHITNYLSHIALTFTLGVSTYFMVIKLLSLKLQELYFWVNVEFVNGQVYKSNKENCRRQTIFEFLKNHQKIPKNKLKFIDFLSEINYSFTFSLIFGFPYTIDFSI